ncbi:unnamed protein product [Lactuca virosa]|uniref:Secreted protein n=1 Tax=Lactuca virosa TaxID=75947 RepID=A0AAU9MI61_9ASTR|nr:unnamed protein product [Lactuca virosa]
MMVVVSFAFILLHQRNERSQTQRVGATVEARRVESGPLKIKPIINPIFVGTTKHKRAAFRIQRERKSSSPPPIERFKGIIFRLKLAKQP